MPLQNTPSSHVSRGGKILLAGVVMRGPVWGAPQTGVDTAARASAVASSRFAPCGLFIVDVDAVSS